MADRTDVIQLENLDILDEACDRNLSIELHYYSRSGQFFAAKTRLLGIIDNVLQLDTPQSIGRTVHLSQGQIVEAFLINGLQIHTFKARITDTDCHIQLNQHEIVDGLAMTKPTSIKDGQRRHDDRLSIAILDEDIPVVMHEIGPDSSDTSRLNPPVFHGRLVNISGGGCGVILDTLLKLDLNVVKLMFLGITLPDQETDFIFQVEVRYANAAGPREKGTRLGLQFLGWPHQAYLRKTVRQVEKFIAQMQRQAKRKHYANRG